MPTGGWQTYDCVLRNIAPFTRVKVPGNLRMLDLGVGGGRWGFLFRDCMEWRADRYFPNQWKYRVDGIEVFEQYRNPCWQFYDDIQIGTIQDRIGEIERREPYDFILFMDVIEHLPKEMGLDLLGRLVARARNRLLISFPDGTNPAKALHQGTVHDNPHEAHISLWTVDELARLGYTVLDREGNSFAALQGGLSRT